VVTVQPVTTSNMPSNAGTSLIVRMGNPFTTE
jgi:hypothetical protein